MDCVIVMPKGIYYLDLNEEKNMQLEKMLAIRNNKIVYVDGDTCYKVFNEDYLKEDIFKEAYNQVRVESLGLSVPKVLGVTTVEDKWTLSSQFIPGRTLSRLMTLEPEKKAAYMELFVRVQRQMHSRNCPQLTRLQEKMDNRISRTDLPATVRYSLHEDILSMPRENHICHGDLVPSNVLIRKGDGVPFILDWSHVTRGYAPADAARTYLLFTLNEDKEGAELYLSLYCRESGLDEKEIRRWLPAVAASQLVLGNEAEREILHAFIGV